MDLDFCHKPLGLIIGVLNHLLCFLNFFGVKKLLGLDTEKIAEALTSTSTVMRGSVIKRRLKHHQAIGEVDC